MESVQNKRVWSTLNLELPQVKSLSIMFLTLIMGILIVIFNVQGYGNLFPDEKWFGIATPFAALLGVTELAVLWWSSQVIYHWPSTSRILKWALGAVTLAFFALSFSGINSYLSNLATKDFTNVQIDNEYNRNNEQLVEQSRNAQADIKQELEQLRQQRSEIISSMDLKNQQINHANQLASDRRLKALVCNDVPDCKAAVDKYEDEANRISQDLQSLSNQRNNLDARINRKEEELDILSSTINQSLSMTKYNRDKNAGTQIAFEQKQNIYANIVLKITGWFGWQPKDPFGVFINFVSGLIYPMYFLLNLYNALNSPENCKAREKRRNQLSEKSSVTNKLILRLTRQLRARLLRKKRENAKRHCVLQEQKDIRSVLMMRLIRYFRVWANRRTKTRIKEVERIVEIPTIVEKEVDKIVEVLVEVEKLVDKIIEVEVIVEKTVEVIKEIPVEVRVEVPVEVDRIVKVDQQVPVYIDRIKEVPVPYFIPDPQILVHERIIPVPEGITGEELEAILKAQPILNQEARTQQNSVRADNQLDTVSQPKDKHEVFNFEEAQHAQPRS
ncbi:hypothetical protein K8B83_04890 [Shewanella inventionis]|uniref:DUF4407 domain-containing protein n=1 Tax=Shewanella inventionis TaxID=1738770 RepID=A0ABQ1IMV5_9GAMM|nr:IMCp domain-containing protein [Shewanella inventionis]MCL1156492.1 hypothetical protein [Shewanella inventionis]UAL44186.1 hypothetical protein K8B83_04890 [Shewanella inventionis]GGB45963.1 hypothetical protein GCM10011607_02550 [Shewanella inventionis]